MGTNDVVVGKMTVVYVGDRLPTTVHLVQCYVISSLRRYPPTTLMYRSGMGAHRSPVCTTGGSYYDEVEEGESNECSDLSLLLIGTRCHRT